MRKTLLIVLATFLMICTGPISQVVMAGQYQPVDLQFDSQLGRDLNLEGLDVLNAGNHSDKDNFKRIVSGNGYNGNGIYWGNLFPSYHVDLFRYDSWVSFNMSFNFTKQDIQFGTSSYWVRVPIDGDRARRVIMVNQSTRYNDMDDYINFWTNDDSVLDVQRNNNNKRVIWDYTGIYINSYYPLLPGQHNFTFYVQPIAGNSLAFWLSNEYYTMGDYNITFFSYRTHAHFGATDPEYQNVIIEGLGSSLAISFMFVSGFDTNGYSSIELLRRDIIISYDLVNKTHNGTYPSIYLPFRSNVPVNFTILWEVPPRVGASLSSMLFKNPDGGATSEWVMTNISSQRDFILVSCPWYLNDTDPATQATSDFLLTMEVMIMPRAPIWVLSTIIEGAIFQRISQIADPFGQSHDITFSEISIFNNTMTGYNIFLVLDYSSGLWVRTKIYNGVSWIDLGWAEGARYPGTSEIYIFLDSGAEVYFAGDVSELWDRILEDEYLIQQAIKDGAIAAVRWVADGFLKAISRYTQTGLQYLKGMLDFLISMFKKIWRFMESVFEYFVAIFQIIPLFIAVVLLEWTASLLVHRKTVESGGAVT